MLFVFLKLSLENVPRPRENVGRKLLGKLVVTVRYKTWLELVSVATLITSILLTD